MTTNYNSIRCRLSARYTRARLWAARMCMPRLNNPGDGQLSMIFPVADTLPREAADLAKLVEISLAAASAAGKIDLNDVSDRMSFGTKWPNIWPGEHYKLLAGLIAHIRPSTVVEVGTFLGLSALAIRKILPPAGRLVTFDVFPWDSFSATCLRQSDFSDGRIEQRLGDLADPKFFRDHVELLAKAQVIFLDGPKNLIFERAFLENLKTVPFIETPLLVIDDIRLWNMLDIWREIQLPKLDITSLGHFTGTGLVMLNSR